VSPPEKSRSQHKDLVRRFYDIGSRYYSEICGEHIHDGYYLTGRESREEAQENLVKYLAAGAGIKAGDRVLDAGCGIGGSSVWLARNLGAATLGITISPVQLNMARKKAAEHRADSAFLLMDAEDMHFDAPFDVIWAVAMCTHLPDQAGFIGAATRFLNPGGRFVIFDWMLGEAAAPGDACIEKVRRGMILASLHTMPEYLAWFTDRGYRIVSAEDITSFTFKTWDDALSLVRQKAAWMFVAELAANEAKHAIDFLRSLGAMKEAMATHRLIGGAIIAERA
jgi:tocopherol O-methyltransferase